MTSGTSKNTELPPALVMGLSPTGLYAIRELARAGIPVIGVTTQRQSGLSSRFLSDKIVLRDLAELAILLCRRFADAPAKPVLIPTSDEFVEFIISNHERLSEVFRFQKSYSDGIAARILDKDQFYQICEQHQVAYPKLLSVHLPDLLACADKVKFPCMIKPSLIHEIKDQMAGGKGWIAKDVAELNKVAAKIPEDSGTLLVQEIIPGPESEITLHCAYYDGAGGVFQPFTARKLRQYPPGFGSASLVQSNPEPGSKEIVERLLCEVGYRGIAAGEFKRDPRDGELKIIEINTRPSLWFSNSTASHKSVVLAAYHDLARSGVQLEDAPQTDGIQWRYWTKDLWSAAFYRGNTSFILPPPDIEATGPASGKTNAVFAIDDPLPALSELMHLARKAAVRLLGKFRAR